MRILKIQFIMCHMNAVVLWRRKLREGVCFLLVVRMANGARIFRTVHPHAGSPCVCTMSRHYPGLAPVELSHFLAKLNVALRRKKLAKKTQANRNVSWP